MTIPKHAPSALLGAALLACGAAPAAAAEGEPYPRIYRTFMPESAPSAFAVELSPELSLCYDPLRGGVNFIWTGPVDLGPTLAAKINDPAELLGEVLYREEEFQPLRSGDPAREPERRFRGYRYEEGAAVFEYTLDGVPVSERIRAGEGAEAVERTFSLPSEGAPYFLRVEAQDRAAVEVRAAAASEVEEGLWRFEEGGFVTMLISLAVDP